MADLAAMALVGGIVFILLIFWPYIEELFDNLPWG